MTIPEMSRLLDSVYLLLQKSVSPMRPKELAAALIQRGMWQSQGKTPDATVGARIYEDIKKHGNQSRFIKAAEGLFALNPNVKIELSDSGEKAGKAVKRKQPEKSAGSYSFSDCAEKVLLHFSGNAPMHYRDITSKALELGWLKTEGLTPEASMYAQILTEIQRREKQGKIPASKSWAMEWLG